MVSGKGSVANFNGVVRGWGVGWAGGLSPSARDLGCRSLRKFLGSKEHLGWLNNTHRENFALFNLVQKFIEIQVWLLLTFFLCLHNQLISVYILHCQKIKEYRCLNNVIHRLEINKWLLVSAFQQAFQQKLSWYLSSYRKTLFLRGFILKPTERM